MNEADILALTYEDKVTVYRAFKDTLSSGESVFKKGFEGQLIYSDKECALSGQSGGKINQSASTARTPTEHLLFTRPEIDIQPNDYLVISHLGKNVVAVAGLAERLSSHNNIPIKIEKEVV